MLISLWFVDFLKGNLLILYGKIFLTANGFFIQEILTFQGFLVGSLELLHKNFLFYSKSKSTILSFFSKDIRVNYEGV